MAMVIHHLYKMVLNEKKIQKQPIENLELSDGCPVSALCLAIMDFLSQRLYLDYCV